MPQMMAQLEQRQQQHYANEVRGIQVWIMAATEPPILG